MENTHEKKVVDRESSKQADYVYVIVATLLILIISPTIAIAVLAGGMSPIVVELIAESLDNRT